MKEVLLKSLTLCNFKGEVSRTTTFGDGVTTIAGANGIGKSRHFDAYLWLLFGKDAQDRKDYEVKTRRADGSVLHEVECSVEGVLLVDGTETTLKRAIVEEWVKPRGAAERVYKGDTTKCWWNGVPLTVGEYSRRVAALIADGSDTAAMVFKILTNPAYFATMDWRTRRGLLMALAGDVRDEEVAAGNADFTALLRQLSGTTLSDFRAERAARKKRLNNELRQIQPRIDQTVKVTPEREDSAALAAAAEDAAAQMAQLIKERSDIDAAHQTLYAKRKAQMSKIEELRERADSLVRAANSDVSKRQWAVSEQRSKAQRELARMQDTMEEQTRTLARCEDYERQLATTLATLAERRNTLLDEWRTVSSEEYSGSDTCAVCGQPLPADKLAQARELFENGKAQRLVVNISQGKAVATEIAHTKQKMAESAALRERTRQQWTELAARYATAQTAYAALPRETDITAIAPQDLPEWVALQQEIDAMQQALDRSATVDDTTDIDARMQSLDEQQRDLVTRQARQKIVAECDAEVARLEERGRDLAQQIADIEHEEFILHEFTRAKVAECEKRINSQFTMVTFQMYEYTLDGNPVETCIPLIKGVPYGTANTASKINAGIDIITTMCRYYGITMPIFIDNRESVNEITPTASQVVNLLVTTDDTLTVTATNSHNEEDYSLCECTLTH